MKIKLITTALFLLCLTGSLSAQYFDLSVSYLKKENDRNNSERLESFSVSGRTASYSVEYKGKSMPGEVNETKNCNLSDYSFNSIINSVTANKIKQNVTVYRKEKIDGENIMYLVISAALVMDGETYTISLDGEANLVMGENIYRNVIDLIKDLRKIIKEC